MVIVKVASRALLLMGHVMPVSLDGMAHGATSSARTVTMVTSVRRSALTVGTVNHVTPEQGSVGVATQVGLDLSECVNVALKEATLILLTLNTTISVIFLLKNWIMEILFWLQKT